MGACLPLHEPETGAIDPQDRLAHVDAGPRRWGTCHVHPSIHNQTVQVSCSSHMYFGQSCLLDNFFSLSLSIYLFPLPSFLSDGGVYFSTLGPAAYDLGSAEFEENIIVDCFGVERLEEYRGKAMLDLCFVYGAEPGMLSQAPGGRDNAKMITKTLFHSLALPAADGNYFLRPDRILAAFFLPATEPPVGHSEAKEALAAEKAADAATKERLTLLQRRMKKDGNELREAHLELHRSEKLGADDGGLPQFGLVGAKSSGEIGGDIELPLMTSLASSEEDALKKAVSEPAFKHLHPQFHSQQHFSEPQLLPPAFVDSLDGLNANIDGTEL
jgi:hypothetical protein